MPAACRAPQARIQLSWHRPLVDAAMKAGSETSRLHRQAAVLTMPGCMLEQVPCFRADIVAKLAKGLI